MTGIHRMRANHATRFIARDATPRASTPRARRRTVVKRAHFRHVTTRASGDDDDGRASTDDSSDASASSRAGLDGGKYGMGERIDRALDATTNQLGFVVGGRVDAIGGRVVHVRTSTSDGVLVHRRGRMWSVGVL